MAGNKPSPTPKPKKTPGNGDPTNNPTGNPKNPGGNKKTEDPLNTFDHFQLSDWILHHLWIIPIILIAALIGINQLWKRFSLYQTLRGRATPPLGFTIKRALKVMYKEDPYPVFVNIKKLAAKTQWLTWKTYWRLLTPLTILQITYGSDLPLNIGRYTGGLLLIAWLAGIKHLRSVFSYRHRVLMQMTEVAASEMRYARGFELNPWGWVQITEWHDLYTPGITNVMYPPKFRSAEPRARESFEDHFNGTVSDQHTWTYEWETANNRVVCTPVPFITTSAPYPFPDTHPWDEFPLGIAAGGKEAKWICSQAPHALVAGTTGSGKNLKLDSGIPVPVSERHPDGWTTIGDIEEGDVVFDEKGNPCRVTGVSEINETPDLYRVTFSDGSTLDADGDHLWWTETRQVRESRWNAGRKTVERRQLVSPDRIELLRNAATNALDGEEVSLTEVAELAGINAGTTWFREVAASVGHTGEVQYDVVFEYAEQTVTQVQKVTVFDAQKAWSALARFEPGGSRRPAWYAHREKCAGLATAAGIEDVVSSRDVAQVLEVTAKQAGTLLRAKGVPGVVGSGDGGSMVFPARKAYLALANSEGPGQKWAEFKGLCEIKASAAKPGEEVLSADMASILGVSPSEVVARLKPLGVKGTVERREVTLQVPAKTVARKGPFVPVYPKRELFEAVVRAGERMAHDQRHLNTLGGVRTTLEIKETLHSSAGQANHAVPVAGALQMPDAELNINPYLLGVWLGDGFSKAGKFCGIDHEIADLVRADGDTVYESRELRATGASKHQDFRIWRVENLTTRLREFGLLQKTTEEGSQKRIPAIYLRASLEQRSLLLAGLLDTDGTVAPQGTVHFDNTNKVLIDQVAELASTLGYRVTVVKKRLPVPTSGRGAEFTYRVAWTCGESPFRLTRKTETFNERNKNHNEQRTQFRYITNIEKIPPVPARCIMVDSPSRLFLVGDRFIPTHNSVTQRTILLHALTHPDWRIVALDPKRVELSAYRGHPNVLRIATELDEQVALVEQVEQEMQSRYKKMTEHGVNFFKDMPDPPPALLLMIDETYALLSPENVKSEEGKERDALHARAATLVGSIARLGRAAGVHMILATQRPDAKVISGETKANLDCRIAQGRMDTTPSLMTMDSDAATKIPNVKGRAVMRSGNDYTEFQAYFLPMEQLPQVLEMTAALATGRASADMFLLEPEEEESKGRFGWLRKPGWLRLPAGLSAGVSGWVERRKAVVAENEMRAGRTPEARAARKAAREAEREARRAGVAGDSGDVASVRHEKSAAEVVAEFEAAGESFDDSGLFDGFDIEQDYHAAGAGLPGEDFDEFDDEVWTAPPQPLMGEFEPAPEPEVASVPEPEPERVQPVVGRGSRGYPGLPVQEVLDRAMALGAPIPASELLAALRAAAQGSGGSPAPAARGVSEGPVGVSGGPGGGPGAPVSPEPFVVPPDPFRGSGMPSGGPGFEVPPWPSDPVPSVPEVPVSGGSGVPVPPAPVPVVRGPVEGPGVPPAGPVGFPGPVGPPSPVGPPEPVPGPVGPPVPVGPPEPVPGPVGPPVPVMPPAPGPVAPPASPPVASPGGPGRMPVRTIVPPPPPAVPSSPNSPVAASVPPPPPGRGGSIYGSAAPGDIPDRLMASPEATIGAQPSEGVVSRSMDRDMDDEEGFGDSFEGVAEAPWMSELPTVLPAPKSASPFAAPPAPPTPPRAPAPDEDPGF